ncbi:hypothetical protein DY000_02034593 [Brassica cretica]|uniref:RNase H type-1 domain-containing protein n=1 Tax=Brassica cretica TaxID=69181 RepID=A0ABQ7DEC2_BRACR|nr:hypothetical protein DY000_02034593 [Brassica cretica]
MGQYQRVKCIRPSETGATDTYIWQAAKSDAIIKFRKDVCLLPSRVSGNILPWVCWALWIACNTLIFEDQLSTPEETATRAIRSSQEWGLAQGLKDQIPKRAENQPNLNQNQPERNTIMVCKSDAAWDKGSNKAWLAWILIDASGICKHRGATTQDFVSSPLIAKALALRSGIISASAMEISDLQMLSDNQTLIKAINNDIQNPEIYGIVKDIQKTPLVLSISLFLLYLACLTVKLMP